MITKQFKEANVTKALISFLGTSDYVDCRYVLEEEKGPVVKYVQEDMALRFCSNWSETDEIRIFTTRQAKKANWNDNGHKILNANGQMKNTGLAERLDLLKLKPAVKQIDIPIGNSEKEIWETFNIVFATMGENEEIIFDITHSFRSIPMLFMVLAGYAGIMKNVTVSGIFYGAFEALGSPPRQVKIDIPDPEKRISPIFDLTSFVQLTDWSLATQSFIRHGIAGDFVKLVGQKTNPVLKNTHGKNRTARNMNSFVKEIKKLSRNIQHNRGYEIIQYDSERAINNIQNLKKDLSFIPPFGPLLEKIEQKVKGFNKYDIQNGFRAVEWCMEHDLIQQAVTMLWENIITWILDEETMDWTVKSNREDVSYAMHSLAVGKKKLDPKNLVLVEKLKKNRVLAEISSHIEALRTLRNDLNHGGFIRERNKMAKSSESIREHFKIIFNAVQEQLF